MTEITTGNHNESTEVQKSNHRIRVAGAAGFLGLSLTAAALAPALMPDKHSESKPSISFFTGDATSQLAAAVTDESLGRYLDDPARTEVFSRTVAAYGDKPAEYAGNWCMAKVAQSTAGEWQVLDTASIWDNSPDQSTASVATAAQAQEIDIAALDCLQFGANHLNDN